MLDYINISNKIKSVIKFKDDIICNYTNVINNLPSTQQQLLLIFVVSPVESGKERTQWPPIILISVLLGESLLLRFGCRVIRDSPSVCLSSQNEENLEPLRQFRNFPQSDCER